MSSMDDAVAVVRESLRPRLAQTLLALDFDGVLAPIVERPQDARALPGTAELLTQISPRVAQVAIVTGRPASDAVQLGGLADVPGLVVCGHYGLERWMGGRLETPSSDSAVDEARVRVAELVAQRPGTAIEDKGHSVAVHTRRAPDPAASLEDLRPLVSAIAEDTGLQVTPGRFVLELRPRGADKGVAVRQLAAEAGAAAVVYGGDDLGDLPAIEAVRALEADGMLGVIICSDGTEVATELREAADLVVPGPEGVQRALRSLLL
ncbi:trehalose-phosphatase [Phytoactinopolyspora mesophila]|uniref:Trehalose 6-phosphate phosphatase n=1 Tax=Phytoactinopolyspora mesophila TaxID=2650750 RepID=A0A7K3M4J9_9ACTN|nr:trehalose-phosphatase [Phytoactinopolyspora mesophila]NDL58175.1 trehalose-phosphatase [Phytoactinopolyspora mesophila]